MTTTTTPSFAGYGQQFADFYDDIFPREMLSAEHVTWLADRIPADAQTVVELGVGTGRVAIPLQRVLRERNPGIQYIGIDISQEMIDKLQAADPEGSIDARVDDITTIEYDMRPDVVLCVCATISMICDEELQRAAIKRAAAALKPGGKLVVETHHAPAVSAMHVYESITYCVPYPGHQRALVSFSTLKGNQWHIDHAWLDNGAAVFASEDSKLTSLEELDTFARESGLEVVGHSQGLSEDAVSASSPTVTAVYRKPH